MRVLCACVHAFIGGGDTLTGAFDFMAYHNNRYFSTNDRDNDVYGRGNCAVAEKVSGGGATVGAPTQMGSTPLTAHVNILVPIVDHNGCTIPTMR